MSGLKEGEMDQEQSPEKRMSDLYHELSHDIYQAQTYGSSESIKDALVDLVKILAILEG